MNPILSIRGLTKIYRHQTVLKSINLEISSGSIFALLGPNGSGKTTLIKIVLGLVHPTSYKQLEIKSGVTLGYMPQQANFPPNMKVFELFELIQKLRKQRGKHLKRLINEFQIDSFEQKLIRELSGGMRQKVNIAQAFMFENELLLLDEPTLGLDPHITFLFKKLIKERRQQGATILLTSHIMSEVEELADRLALLVDGKIHLEDSPQAIITQAQENTLENALHHYWTETYEDSRLA